MLMNNQQGNKAFVAVVVVVAAISLVIGNSIPLSFAQASSQYSIQ
jgi:hypothetical protein